MPCALHPASRPKSEDNGVRFGEAKNPGPPESCSSSPRKKEKKEKNKEYFGCRIKGCTLQFHYHPIDTPGAALTGAARRTAEKKAAVLKANGEKKKTARLKFALCAFPDCATGHFHAEEQLELYGLMRRELPADSAARLLPYPCPDGPDEPYPYPDGQDELTCSERRALVNSQDAIPSAPPAAEPLPAPELTPNTEPNPVIQGTGREAEQENNSDSEEYDSESGEDSQLTWRPEEEEDEESEGEGEEKTVSVTGYWGQNVDVPVGLNTTVIKAKLNFNMMGDASLIEQMKRALLAPFTHAHDSDKHSAYIKLNGFDRKVGRFDKTFSGSKAHQATNFTEGAYQSSSEIYVYQELLVYLDGDSTHRLGQSNCKPNINTLNHCNTTLRKMDGYSIYTALKHEDPTTGITWHGGTIVMLTVAYWLQRHYATSVMIRAATEAAGVPKNQKSGGGMASTR
jgi:hypothetical protein